MKKTIYKPWTENTCPLKVGDVLWDPLNKRDIMVTVRIHSATYKDDPDENIVVLGDCPYSGQELLDYGIECWDNYPDKGTSYKCWDNYPDKGTSYKCCEAHLAEEHWVSGYFTWERHLPLADLPDVGKAIKCFKDAVLEGYAIADVMRLGLALKDSIQRNWMEPEPEWFDAIDSAVLTYAKEKENIYLIKENEDVEN